MWSVSIYFMLSHSYCCCFTITGVVIAIKKISMRTTAAESSNEVVAEMAAWVTLAYTFIYIYIKNKKSGINSPYFQPTVALKLIGLLKFHRCQTGLLSHW